MHESRPMVALDFPSLRDVKNFLLRFDDHEKLYVKVGMELLYQEGPVVVDFLKFQGHDVFLDLKLHDIPNTVGSAMKGLARLGIDMINVHAAGGIEMMQQAKEGLIAGTPAGEKVADLIAVTQLTSTSQESMQHDQMIMTSLEESVLHYAKCTDEAGLDGVVCSAHEVQKIKSVTRPDFICLTPGIRPAGAAKGDQKRVVTPEEARTIGSDYIVVGRPITRTENPMQAYQTIKNEWNGHF
ncbi:MAG TPA: orotidine-5'-phosphate decarboxylase [Lactococcus sp.]|uniref:Orotidine 5'-phosphate decarboxylase n=1 Tax=Lactococcus muris TaxID=2941330 RepID=A0ABV4D677_9LACT|nr:orotidine-5'-phosphate decarboxylase [Lactococcus muris]HAP15984.1 orotidine-5'-phosphate decarboxylase [Lactococcus sp.]HBC90092.1 orotidine-5'-phosphate decarboxylase [Lactococcus sp.]